MPPPPTPGPPAVAPRRPVAPVEEAELSEVDLEPDSVAGGRLAPAPAAGRPAAPPAAVAAPAAAAVTAPAVALPVTEGIKTQLGAGTTESQRRVGASALELVELCERQLQGEKDEQRVGRLHYEMARLLESALGERDKAGEHYLEAHKRLKTHLPSLRGARRALFAQKAYQAALPLFDAEIRLAAESPDKALLFYEKGRLLEEQMSLKREAREAYEAAAELEKQDLSVLKAVEHSEHLVEAWDALDRTFEREANAASADPRFRAAVVAERARLVESKKNDPRTAAELYLAALDLDPSAGGARDALERLHTTHARWHDLVAVLEREAAQATDATVRAMALYRVGRVQTDRLGKLDAAIDAMERAARDAPADVMVLEELARLYEITKRWDVLAAVLERLAALADGATRKIGYLHRIGQIAEERLGSEEQAIVWYERALAEDPTYLPALHALSRLYTRRKQWEPLCAMYLREAEATHDTPRRAAGHAKIAEIQEEQLGIAEQAIVHHARALGLVPLYAPSFKALSRLYAESRRYRELVELYERAVDGYADPESKVTYLFKIGQLQEDSLGAPGQALAAYRRILDIEPKNLGALHSLQRAAERSGRYKELVQALESEAEQMRDRTRAVALVHRAGEVYEQHLDDLEGALARYEKALGIDDRYGPALASLGRLYERAGRWDDLSKIYRRELAITPRGPAHAALLYAIGELCEARLGKDEDALGAYRQAIEVDPFHEPALHALARKLGERNQHKELVKLIELELSGQKDPVRRSRTAFRLGEVYEHRLNGSDKALAAYEQALANDPTFRPAVEGRTRLLEQARDWKRLVEELERQANAAVDPALAIAARFRLAQIYRDELNDAQRAIDAFEKVLESQPGHLGALLALEPLYLKLSAWEKLAGVYATQASVLADPKARVAALRELARLQQSRGVGAAEALEQTFGAILAVDPDDVATLVSLEQLALVKGDRGLLAHVDAKLGARFTDAGLAAASHTRLGEALEGAGDPNALAVYRAALGRDASSFGATRGLSRLAERSDDPQLFEEAAEFEARVTRDRDLAARLLVASAQKRVQRGEADAAVKALERALAIHPGYDVAVERVRELLLSRGEVDRLIELLSGAARAADQPEQRASRWIAVADLHADQRRDLPAAMAALGRVLAESAGHVPTLLKLSELYARDGQWNEAVDKLRQVVAQAPPQDVLVNAHLQLAAILDEKLRDAERARKSVEAVLRIDPGQRAALARLVDIQTRTGQLEQAAATASQLVKTAPDRTARAEALLAVARLERTRGAQGPSAQAYEQAVELVGLAGGAADEFKKVLSDQRGGSAGWGRYVAALTRHIEQNKLPPATLAQIYREMGRVVGDQLGNAEQAIETLQLGLASAEDAALRSELAFRLQRAGKHPQAIQEFRRVLETDALRADVYRALGESFQVVGRPVEAALTIAPIAALGAANDLELSTLSTRPLRTAVAHPGSFDAAALKAIDVVGEDPAVGMLAALSESLEKIHPPELERYGLSSRDRIGARTGHPLRTLADRLAQGFSVAEFDLYAHRAHRGGLEVEFTDPVAILVPAYVLELPQSRQAFLLARVLASIARGVHAVDRLAPDGIEMLLAAATRTVEPRFGSGLTDEEFLSNLSKRISKAISRRGRRTLEELAGPYARGPRRNFPEWVSRVRLTSARAAVLMSDDLPGSIELLRRLEGDLAGLQGAALALGMTQIHDLLRFWVSDTAFALRRRIGMIG